MNRKLFQIAFMLGMGVSLQAQTSETNARLKKALERVPQADTNKDGILTLAEAKAYQKKNKSQSGPAGEKPSTAGKQLVYKTVGEKKLLLHVFEPENHSPEASVPAIVFFHGGGWKNGSPMQFLNQCEYLSDSGMVAITAQYRLTEQPQSKIDDCVEDAKSAMRWVRENATELGIDPSRIAAGGGSAGGHLAACTAVVDTHDANTDNKEVSARPNAMVLFNPALILSPDPRHESRRTNAGEKIKERSRGQPELICPLAHAKSKQAPCIMFFGTKDFLLQPAEFFRDDSAAAGNRCQLITYEGQGHGFFNRGEYTKKTLSETDKFLVDLGWLPSK